MRKIELAAVLVCFVMIMISGSLLSFSNYQARLDKAEAFNIILEFFKERTVGLITSSVLLLGLLFLSWGIWAFKMRR